MIQIFFSHTPRLIRRYTRGQALQFLFCQSWYTLWSISLAVLWALPAVALLVNRADRVGTYRAVLRVLRAGDARIDADVVRIPPVVPARRGEAVLARDRAADGALAGRAVGAINVVLRIKRSYMITPKGKAAGGGPRAISIYAPYIVLAAVPLAAIWLFDAGAGSDLLRGYYWLVLGNALMGAMVLATTLGMDIKQIAAEDSAPRTAVRSRAVVVLALVCLVALFGLSVAQFGHQAVHSMTAA